VTINQGCFTIGLRQNTSEHSVIIMIMALRPVLVLVLLRTLKLEALTNSQGARDGNLFSRRGAA